MTRFAAAIAAFALCIAAPTQAHIMSILTYDELFRGADLVVVAQPATKTTPTGERTQFPDLVTQNADGTQTPVPAIGVETVFEVQKVVKGDKHLKRFVLHHLEDVPSDKPAYGGAATVWFDPSDTRNWNRDILLFLIKETDGRYAPYGGQTDPSGRSIFALQEPFYSRPSE